MVPLDVMFLANLFSFIYGHMMAKEVLHHFHSLTGQINHMHLFPNGLLNHLNHLVPWKLIIEPKDSCVNSDSSSTDFIISPIISIKCKDKLQCCKSGIMFRINTLHFWEISNQFHKQLPTTNN